MIDIWNRKKSLWNKVSKKTLFVLPGCSHPILTDGHVAVEMPESKIQYCKIKFDLDLTIDATTGKSEVLYNLLDCEDLSEAARLPLLLETTDKVLRIYKSGPGEFFVCQDYLLSFLGDPGNMMYSKLRNFAMIECGGFVAWVALVKEVNTDELELDKLQQQIEDLKRRQI